MANLEHLAMLASGVQVWNAWRRENRAILPDLREADLGKSDLRWANLREADLRGANLSRADLRESDLRWANLLRGDLRNAVFANADVSGANLRGANAIGASLQETNLGGANVGGANLSRASLERANLSGMNANYAGGDVNWANPGGANLREADLALANLTGAQLGNTIFAGTRLRDAVGLDLCRHVARSYLDYHTLAESGSLPVSFLRGCGLSDKYIEFLPSLLLEAIRFYSCFISYSSKDEEFAQRIWGDLQNKNVRCWYAPEDLKIGDKFQERIEDSIRLHDKLLIVLSAASVNSSWVEREVQAAREREDRSGKPVLFPIRVDDSVMNATKAWAADLRRTRHIGDFTRWQDHASYQKAFERLLRDLKAENAPKSASVSE
jgi:uncharacterized protein YjbI with pentapeptide repeats